MPGGGRARDRTELARPNSPWQNPHVERLIGSIRRERLDHVVVLGQNHVRRIMQSAPDARLCRMFAARPRGPLAFAGLLQGSVVAVGICMRLSAPFAVCLGCMIAGASCGGGDAEPGPTPLEEGGTDAPPPPPEEAGTDAPSPPQDGSTDAPLQDAQPDSGAATPATPVAITFVDEDPREGFVEGTASVTRALDETKIDRYRIAWTDDAGNLLAIAVEVPKTAAAITLTLPPSTPVPAGAARIAAQGMMGSVESTSVWTKGDNYPRLFDIGGNAGMDVLQGPQIAVDPFANKVLAVGTDWSGRPSLRRCNLDGTSCTAALIDVGRGRNSGWFPSVAVDRTSRKLLVVTVDKPDEPSGQRPSLFRCDLDGTNCVYADVSAGRGAHSGGNPFVLLDDANGKLLVFTEDMSTLATISLFRCERDGTGCARVQISPPPSQTNPVSSMPNAVIDSSNAKLLVVANRGGKLWLYRCALDGTSCVDSDISAGRPKAAAWPRAAIDASNGKLLVVTADSSSAPSAPKTALYRCELDGTACTYREIAGPMPTVRPRLLVAHGELFVVADISHIARCTLDGASCTMLDLSQSRLDGVDPDPAMSPGGDMLMLVGQNGGSHLQPMLFRYALDGSLSARADVSAGPGSGFGYRPHAVLNPKTDELLVVTGEGVTRAGTYLFRCATDSMACANAELPAMHTTDFVIDSSGDKLVIAGGATPALLRCNTDGTSCTQADISAGAPANVVSGSSLVLDAPNGKLLLSAYDTSTQRLSNFRCNVDGTAAEYHPLLTGGATHANSAAPSAMIANGKLLVATLDYGAYPTLYTCALDASSCERKSLALPANHTAQNPSAVVFGSQVIVTALDVDSIANTTQTALIRCALDGTNCTYASLPFAASLPLVDAAKQKLLLIDSGGSSLNLFRCELDGTGCTSAMIASALTVFGPSAVVDAAHHRLLVAGTNLTNLERPSVLALDLW
jgi:hypothetical protein